MQVSDPREAAPRTTSFEAPAPVAARVEPALAPYNWLPQPTTFQDAMEFCKLIANSDLAPKDYKAKPANVMIAIQMGGEIGLKPLQSIQGIAVIGGRPAVYGDTALAVVRRSPEFVAIKEWLEGEDDERVARCTVTRRNEEPLTRSFSVSDAKRANLWGKDGPWKLYTERMLQMRARSFAIRDGFPDALKGLSIVEDVMDIVEPSEARATIVDPSATRTASVREALAKQISTSAIAPTEGAPGPAVEQEAATPVRDDPGAAAVDAVEPAVPDTPPAPAHDSSEQPDVTAASIQGSADKTSAEYITTFAAKRGLSNGALRTFIFNVTGSARLTKRNVPLVLEELTKLSLVGEQPIPESES